MPMSNANTPRTHTAAEAVHKTAEVARGEAREGRSFLQRHGRHLVLLFAGLLLPLWGFAELADDVRDADAFPFDEPTLRFAQAIARDGFDQWFLLFSHLGYTYGVVPFDVALVVALAFRRRFRESIFAAAALAGSALLNLATKELFARARPTLWDSIAPEHTYSFPSGHAMGSMTLAVVLVLLAWPTRWRWIAMGAMGFFVVMVGLSRIYLGVHYPSDILAGWAAAIAWAMGCYGLMFRDHLRPWGKR
jgi:membrane-associated phospholipid phosphatase